VQIQDNEPVIPAPGSNPWRKLVTRRQLLSAAGKGALALGAGSALSGLVNSSASASTDRAAGRAAASGASLDFGIEYTLTANQESVKKIIIDPFLKTHPAVSAVNYTVFSSASALDSGLKLDFASGTGPDVFDENGPSYMPPFATSHTALELDEFYAKYNLRKRMFPWTVEPNLYKGHYYAVPCEYEGLHLWYNIDMFKQYGWQVPTNYDDILALGKEIQSKGKMVFAAGFSDCIACWEWFHTWALNAQLGAKGLRQVLVGERPWTDPTVVMAMENLKQLWDLGFIADKDASAITYNEHWTLFGEGRAAMVMEGTWGFGGVSSFFPHINYGVTQLPMWNPLVETITPIGVGEVLGIHSKTKYPALCEEFVASIAAPTSEKVAAALASELAGIYVPCVPISTSAFAPGSAPKLYAETLGKLQTQMAAGKCGYVAWCSWPFATEAYMYDNLSSMLIGTISVADYLKGTQRVFDKDKADGNLPTVPVPNVTA
jgi:raffinose/stachyose/melibiose transport system substrate-binding protein